MMKTNEVALRLQKQQQRLEHAAVSAGRAPAEITLVAVSKKQSVEAILEAYEAGQRDFGENYVQELRDKAEQLAHCADLRWHLIGHLQTNKARVVADLIHCLHTVCSDKLVRELGSRVRQRRVAAGNVRPLSVLVEVNVSGEASKSGCRPDELPGLLQAVEAEEGLTLRGLMTMPPYDPDPERTRPFFEQLRELRELHGGASRLPDMSMGMSHDMHVAIAAGATLVRVGSAIFGERST